MGVPAKYGFMVFAFVVCFAVFIYFFDPSFFFPKQCTFSGSILECVEYSMDNATLELTLRNQAGKDMMIQDIMIKSEVLVTGSCSLQDSDMNVRLDRGKKHRFIINRSADNSSCAFTESAEEKNRYDVRLMHAKIDGGNLLFKPLEGRIVV